MIAIVLVTNREPAGEPEAPLPPPPPPVTAQKQAAPAVPSTDQGFQPATVFSPEGDLAVYAVEVAGHHSAVFAADKVTGQVTEQPRSDGLVPLVWRRDFRHPVVARYTYTRTELGEGTSTKGWQLQGMGYLEPLPKRSQR